MRCHNCHSEWITNTDETDECPFCHTRLLNPSYAASFTTIGDLLTYLVSIFGEGLYLQKEMLKNLINDLSTASRRYKRFYQRAIIDDNLSVRILSLTNLPDNEKALKLKVLISQFCEDNMYTEESGKIIVYDFAKALKLNVRTVDISTEVENGDGEWIDRYGVKYSGDRKKLKNGRGLGLRKYYTNSDCQAICNRAFSMTELQRITLSSSVTTIGNYAFYHCTQLKHATLSDSVMSIGASAFEDCFELEMINIPNNVIAIRDNAFCRCKQLKTITIPNSVTLMGKYVFWMCQNLKAINIPQGTYDKFAKLLPDYEYLLNEL